MASRGMKGGCSRSSCGSALGQIMEGICANPQGLELQEDRSKEFCVFHKLTCSFENFSRIKNVRPSLVWAALVSPLYWGSLFLLVEPA